MEKYTDVYGVRPETHAFCRIKAYGTLTVFIMRTKNPSSLRDNKSGQNNSQLDPLDCLEFQKNYL
jgi:hypothetical protein